MEAFPKPEIREDEVLIRVKAGALNHLDIWVRMGARAVRPELPHILGADISGVVDRGGSVVKEDIKEGDEVVVAPGLSCGVCYECQSHHLPLGKAFGKGKLCGPHKPHTTKGSGARVHTKESGGAVHKGKMCIGHKIVGRAFHIPWSKYLYRKAF